MWSTVQLMRMAGNVVPKQLRIVQAQNIKDFFTFGLSKNENQACTGKSQGNI